MLEEDAIINASFIAYKYEYLGTRANRVQCAFYGKVILIYTVAILSICVLSLTCFLYMRTYVYVYAILIIQYMIGTSERLVAY